MKFSIITILAFSLSLPLAYSQNHEHHAEHSPKKNSKAQIVTKKFTATEDLKVRMEKILGLMKDLKIKKGDQKEVKDFGNKVALVVQDIFKNCKLEAEADEAIHPALGAILEGSEDFKNGNYESGHTKIHEALLTYEKLFSHEGWKH